MQVVGSISRLFTALAAGVLIAATPLDNAVILGSARTTRMRTKSR